MSPFTYFSLILPAVKAMLKENFECPSGQTNTSSNQGVKMTELVTMYI